ncbi:MAG: hypothetical protein JETT_2380 [Candidatus Jettenia ecosi]|uniref:Uncharacterized protein n=1 Tax=Candidatus Jettenia ecosi TaxID=2494326 RepID=A0A533Q9K8_9BACT|nr:MAG: hypothetical protein JETT_2380 [Candidatus Jettenia ecosi]
MNGCVFSIAVNTIREITRQSMFYFILCGGILLIFLSFFFTLFAFGEETRMIQEMGISTIMICCLCLASLSATITISSELEKGTMMTLLCKPVNKNPFFLVSFWHTSYCFPVLRNDGAFLAVSLSIKDSLEYHKGLLSSFADIGYSVFFELTCSFFQAAIICSIAIAGSLYIPMVSNVSLCLFLYAMGNSTYFFQKLFQGNEEGFPWYASIFFIFFPNLSGLNTIGTRIGFEKSSLAYVALLILYAILYIMLVIMLTCEFFNKRECK